MKYKVTYVIEENEFEELKNKTQFNYSTIYSHEEILSLLFNVNDIISSVYRSGIDSYYVFLKEDNTENRNIIFELLDDCDNIVIRFTNAENEKFIKHSPEKYEKII